MRIQLPMAILGRGIMIKGGGEWVCVYASLFVDQHLKRFDISGEGQSIVVFFLFAISYRRFVWSTKHE